ncbi:hypothetical protein [Methylomonas sp. AM2-LC]|uniref:hypothetical protein n=1 Tax=Methylomonas sp. AM2-LC TaxID=3153301 RepID=UPI003266B39C
MVAFFRQFLVMILVLLQYGSPVVHAHAGVSQMESGLHLYEFESLHNVLHSHSMMGSKSVLSTESAIINVGVGIKPNLQKYQSWFFTQYYSREVFFDNNRYRIIISEPLLDNCISQPILTANNTRAPPYYIRVVDSPVRR